MTSDPKDDLAKNTMRASRRGRGGFLLFSVAVGATAMGAYYVANSSSDSFGGAVRQRLCEKLECCSPKECGKWDHEWDKKTLEKFINIENKNDLERKSEKYHPTYRHLILVRHGQYHDDMKNDSERTLTEIGRKQAVWCCLTVLVLIHTFY